MRHGKPSFDVIGQLAALRRYAWSLTRNEAQAEDLVQDALVRAYQGHRTFRPDGNLRNWLLSILHNTFANDVRRRRAEAARTQRASEIAETEAAPEQESRVRLAQVVNAFLDLPEEQRAALHLVAIEGMAYQDAAATLGIPVGTLMSRLGRARAALRALEQGAGTEGGPGRRANLRIVGGANDQTR